MRVIEEKMLKAMEFGNDWSNSNTSVTVNGDIDSREDVSCMVRLHGHLICEAIFNHASSIEPNVFLKLDACGYLTNTTASRMRAILNHFAPGYNLQGWNLVKDEKSKPLASGWTIVPFLGEEKEPSEVCGGFHRGIKLFDQVREIIVTDILQVCVRVGGDWVCPEDIDEY